MRKEVRIKVVGNQYPLEVDDISGEFILDDFYEEIDDDPDTVELNTTGIFYTKDGMNILEFDEYVDDVEEPVKNYIKFDEKTMELTKIGGLSTVMEFRSDKWMMALYNTPYGQVQINILIREYSMEITDDNGCIELKYYMDFGNGYVLMCNLNIYFWM